MKNIKTFKQLFENLGDSKFPRSVSFGKDEYEKFNKYCSKMELKWEPSKHEQLYNMYADRLGNFYIVEDQFLIMCKGKTINDIEIINGSDINNKHDSSGKSIKNEILETLNCTYDDLKRSLFTSMITGDSKYSLNDYFRDNPLETYILDDSPELKKEVLSTIGIKDYSSIGRKLRNGLI